MRPTRWIVIFTATFLALLTLIPELAGAGGSVFQFDQQYYVPGDVASGRTTVYFADAKAASDGIREGPFYAYLVPPGRDIGSLRIPADAILIGTVSFIANKHARNLRSARVRFVVPHLKPGSYGVSMCNRPCRTTFVGDLIGGWISIVATREEARLRALEDRVYERLQSQTSEITGGLDERLIGLEEAQNRLRFESQARVATTEKRYLADRDQIERLSAQVRGLQERADQGMFAWLWMAGWIVAAGLAVAWRATVVRRRRSARIPPPSESPLSDEVVWNEVPPPVYERVWQPDRSAAPSELVSR